MPTPPMPGSSTDLTTPTVWTLAGAAFFATLKFARDMFRSRKPENPSLHVAMASLTMAVVDMGNDVKTLRDVIIQSHHKRILAMELERDDLKRRLDDLEVRIEHLRS